MISLISAIQITHMDQTNYITEAGDNANDFVIKLRTDSTKMFPQIVSLVVRMRRSRQMSKRSA